MGRVDGISLGEARGVRAWLDVILWRVQYYTVLPTLDEWLRRQVRMCYWKQWRYARTKVRNLRQLGVNLDWAIKHALTRKSYWRLSRTPAMRIAMPNKWLSDLGLLSLKQLWCDLAPLRGTA